MRQVCGTWSRNGPDATQAVRPLALAPAGHWLPHTALQFVLANLAAIDVSGLNDNAAYLAARETGLAISDRAPGPLRSTGNRATAISVDRKGTILRSMD